MLYGTLKLEMSDLYFPSFKGLAWGSVKTPIWSTKIHKSSGGYEARAASFTYPLWKFRLNYDLLRSDKSHDELNRFIGFFNQCRGAYGSFFYEDPHDNKAENEPFGLSQENRVEYQLTRSLGGFVEPVIAPSNQIVIYLDGIEQKLATDYALLGAGRIRFIQAPLNNKPLTWTGKFFYKCRFLHDTADFEEFLYDFWSLKKIEFQSVRE